ncbi:MAG: hypothetical protein ABDH21_04835 [bacterium]
MKSYDFFDTLVTRSVLKPKDVFYFVGRRLNEKKILNVDPSYFQKARIKAEIIERGKSFNQEVTIDDIYNQLKSILAIDSKIIEVIKKEEMDTELSFLSVIQQNVDLLDENSLIVSDFYWDELIYKAIARLNIKARDVFISSSFGLNKFSGELYDVVKSKYTLDKHVGDGYISDFKSPLSKGIKAVLYTNSKPTRYEEIVYNLTELPYELRSLLAGCMRAVRLSKHYSSSHLQKVHEISSNIIAPFLYLYVNWILNKTKDFELDVLYFVSRDGEILHKISEIIANKRGINIQLRYLYGSRKAWHLASVDKIDEEVLDWIFDPTFYLSFEEICKRIDIEPKILLRFKELSFITDVKKNLTKEERETVKSVFRENKKIQNLILAVSEKKRNLVSDYLKQEGFAKDKRIGIVDVGWRARQQKSLSKILFMSRAYPRGGIYGFYVSLINPVTPFKKDSYLTFFDFKRYELILPYPAIYESFVAASHGSCVGYYKKDSVIEPLLREMENKQMIKWGLEVQQKTILDFTNKLEEHIFSEKVNITNEQLISSRLLRLFLRYPSIEEARCFGSINVCEDQEESKFYPMCQRIKILDLFSILFYNKRKFNHNIWKEGSIVLSYENIYPFLLHLLETRDKIKIKLKSIKSKLKAYFKILKKHL